MSARPSVLTDPEQLKELLGIPFTPEQMACVTAPAAPQVIVAGAGSGKTTVMAARVVWLVGTGAVAPEQVLGLTFTNKAAGELAERVRKALARAGITDPDPSPAEADAAGGEPRISTYHAFAGQLLKDHGMRIGLEPSARLLADATRFQLAARVLREAPGPYPSLTKSIPDLVSDLLALDAELSEHLVTTEDLRAYDTGLLDVLAGTKLGNEDLRKVPEAVRGRLELVELVARYRAAKRSRDLLDFSDQIALSARLATTRPEVGALLREEFRVVLLDEYQDTSVAQRLLLSGLFGAGTGHAVTAVGDPCQAIYGWRGASVANLDDFPEHFPHGDGSPATRFSLSENRRSGGRLLDLANGLAAPLRSMHEGVEALRPAPGEELAGSVRCALLPTHAQELEWLADSVAHLVRTGTEPSEIAVLCRSGGDFARIQAVLVARDVPVEVVGLSGLLHLPEVADLVAVCEVLQDPGANASLVRLLIGPRWRIGARDLALLGRRARQLVARAPGEVDPDERLAAAVEGVDPVEVVSLADALETFLDGAGHSSAAPVDDLPFSAEARVRFAHLAQELRDLRRSLADPLMDVLHRVLGTTGLDVELSASPHALAARRRETLSGFLDVAAGFASLDGEASLLAFLAFLRTAAQYEKGLDHALPGGENTVKVLTAHKSKGLEWDVVVVPDLCAGSFPKEKAPEAWTSYAKVLPYALRGDAETLPGDPAWTSAGLKSFKAALKSHKEVEELRLGYVTFTRPRSLLLASGHWWGPTQKRRRGPSAFLDALRRHCEAGHGEIEAWADEPEPDAVNPALSTPETPDHSWPLPLDPTSLALRRRAAALVESHLATPPPAQLSYLWPPDCEDPSYEDAPWPEEDPWSPPPPDDLPWPEALPDPHAQQPHPAGGAAVPGARPADGPVPPPAGADAAVPGAPGGVRGGAPVSGRGGLGDQPSPHADAPTPRDASWAEPASAAWAGDESWAEPTGPAAAGGFAGAEPVGAARAGDDPWAEPAGGVDPAESTGRVTSEEARAIASWDRDLDALEGELRRARAAVRDVPLPAALSASQLLRLAADEQAFARDLARPMPQPPQPAARQGTRFHAWVESRFDELPLPLLDVLDPETELPGSDQEIADEADLASLKAAFERSAYAERTPHRMEVPVQLTLAGRVIRGRIDAVYKNPDGTVEIVDWKTGRSTDADPLQLAVYRLAWSETTGTPLADITAAFLHVRSGRVIRPRDLPDRARLERILQGKSDADGDPQADG
ncbi:MULTISPECIES: UvrD-helicase domain-containing protein [unclassified Streptomyces]|uniref:UvrD-helicase domain-containing protein n=1 Tax=unclassified Streptomyces TaxID=2593676 RepID=UPI0022507F01|nr:MULTISPECIES: UvrD-helicase domain-containing protein [unclassified Streptomyces]MCX4527941.1 UvrD-helicase domain-containing protein [Streptomyces sp. NBC_01551]MCX4541463.1 UvrD-helicase domain-containing protein [Streptomyces sp. NBC_01565]